MTRLCEWLQSVRYEVHAVDIQRHCYDPPSYRTELHRKVSISWSPERIEQAIAEGVASVQDAHPRDRICVVVHLYGDRAYRLLVDPCDQAKT